MRRASSSCGLVEELAERFARERRSGAASLEHVASSAGTQSSACASLGARRAPIQLTSWRLPVLAKSAREPSSPSASREVFALERLRRREPELGEHGRRDVDRRRRRAARASALVSTRGVHDEQRRERRPRRAPRRRRTGRAPPRSCPCRRRHDDGRVVARPASLERGDELAERGVVCGHRVVVQRPRALAIGVVEAHERRDVTRAREDLRARARRARSGPSTDPVAAPSADPPGTSHGG